MRRPLLAIVAFDADLVFGFDKDTNVALPDAFSFYPAIALFVELVLHAVPIAVLVTSFRMPTGFNDDRHRALRPSPPPWWALPMRALASTPAALEFCT
ncbi:MAG: hypothetical protein R2731_09830 [Nocardioides sp.]